jgi:HAD superfamily hydrolase (TIGR01509 family)
VYDAVLFDMDGLLVDTEPLWLETEIKVMARLGGSWTEADQQHLLGGSMERTVAYLRQKAQEALLPRGDDPPVDPPAKGGRPPFHPPPQGSEQTPLAPGPPAAPTRDDPPVDPPAKGGRPPFHPPPQGSEQTPLAPGPPAAPTRDDLPSALPSAEAVERWMTEGMLERVAAGRVMVRPGARELLAEVAAAGIAHALVTSSQRPFAEAVLASTGLRFPVVVTGDDVTAHKPDPQPYLLAARLLGVDPGRCVALEDSPNGVASATAAGCLVIAVPSLLPIQPAPGRVIVGSLTEVNLKGLGLPASGAGMPGYGRRRP